MSGFRLFFLIVVLLFPIMAHAQDTTAVSVDEYVEELNDKCPISYGDKWAVNSFTMVGDRYALVDIQLPSNLSMFLSSLSGNKNNVKQLWIRQLKMYGEPWNHFVKMMVEADRRIVVNLRPQGSEDTALMTFFPSDFNRDNEK